MPRPDSSGSSRKRRGAPRPTSEGKKSYGNKSERPSRFKKGDDQGKPAFKRSGDRDEKRSFGKPAKNFGSKRPSGFKKSDDQSSDRRRPSGSGFGRKDDGRRSPGSENKFGSKRPSGFKRAAGGDDQPSDRRRPSRSGFGRQDNEKRPFDSSEKKFDSKRPSAFKRSSDSGESGRKPSRSGFGRKDDEKRSSDRPERKFDSKRPSGFKRTGDDEQKPLRSRSGDSERERRPRKESSPFSKRSEESEAPIQSEKIRLNKFIANSGVCSRREADELITMGLISVNGKTITELGYKVNPGDEIRYESKVLRSEKPVYLLMNKPKGYLTTTSDPQERNTVMHIIGNAVKERIYPVGRLDRNTTGLLLLTNDGDLADKLMHPSYNAKKIYKVDLDRPLTKADYDRIAEGVQLEEGRAIVDDVAIVSDDKKSVGIEIHIGWNRVVRRIFEALEYQVVKLDRVVYAGLDKKDLPRGHWRFLTDEEIVRIKHYSSPAKKSKS